MHNFVNYRFLNSKTKKNFTLEREILKSLNLNTNRFIHVTRKYCPFIIILKHILLKIDIEIEDAYSWETVKVKDVQLSSSHRISVQKLSLNLTDRLQRSILTSSSIIRITFYMHRIKVMLLH